jgi:hypothetical protein
MFSAEVTPGRISAGAGRDRGAPSSGHGFKGLALVRGIPFHRSDQVRDQIVSTFQFDIDLGPCLLTSVAGLDETVVRKDECHEAKRDNDDHEQFGPDSALWLQANQ